MSKPFWFAVIVVSVFFGTLFGVVCSESPRFPNAYVGAAVGFLALPAAVVACLLWMLCIYGVHELGHVLAIRALGWECRSVHVLFLTVLSSNGWWRLQFSPRGPGGGYTKYIPRNATPLGGLVVAVAGPFLSLAAGAIAWAVAGMAAPDWRWFFTVSALMSAGLGVVSLLPAAPLRGLMPDGYFIAWYFRDREGYRLWLDMTELYHRAFPTRPRDQAQADLQPRSSAAPYIAYLHLLRYCAEFDAGNVVAAFVEIQAAWDGIQALDKYRPYQASIAFETAVFFTRFAKDDELAATAFGFGLAADPKSDGRRGAEAAKLFVQGCVEEAMRMLDEDCKTVSERKDTRGRLVTHVREWNDRILDAAIPVWSREEMAVEAERGEYPRVCLPIPPAE